MKVEILTAEDWLKQNCKKNDWANIEEDLNDALWTNNVVLYMAEYSEYIAQCLLKSKIGDILSDKAKKINNAKLPDSDNSGVYNWNCAIDMCAEIIIG